jgi:predicted urease superfamily metal-dependent hydrolase
MKWLYRVIGRPSNKPIDGVEYRVTSTLYSLDGKRSAEIREFSHGDTYILESDFVNGGFKERHDGGLVGPFVSPKRAERFIVSTRWFEGDDLDSL